MHEFTAVPPLRDWLSGQRAAGRRIGLVPTMGALHEGHLSLVDVARQHSDLVVLTIFVNPLQFGPGEDFQRYPRDLARDRRLAEARGVAAIFSPEVATMYPPGSETRVVPGATAARWEGEIRPGHFEGVLTVVAKLFHIVEPAVAVFGQKDIQQGTLIKRMVADLDVPISIVIAPTVREPDGLALSSRNAYLDAEGRHQALALSTALRVAAQLWQAGERDSATLERHMREQFRMFSGVTVDYIAVVEPDYLTPVNTAATGTIIAVAARVGSTRLLDNLILGTEFR
ncbi:MAG TPA: pantoate--beta-alanine ligase [Gemmatimonadales bacterium]|nr:pantoate--beta-alanine ligase [Gemmatimonadales bacterium]